MTYNAKQYSINYELLTHAEIYLQDPPACIQKLRLIVTIVWALALC